jgi:hypothetical protein
MNDYIYSSSNEESILKSNGPYRIISDNSIVGQVNSELIDYGRMETSRELDMSGINDDKKMNDNKSL